MLTTFIPYFLLANVPDKSVWQNGPEFKFDSNVEIKMNGANGTNQVHGFNITNEFICRPKTEISLQCHFQNKKLIAYMTDTDTGKTESKDRSAQQIYEPFFFEVGFHKQGVDKIIVPELVSKHKARLDIPKAMASSLNVASDLSRLKATSEPVELGKVQTLYSGQCKGDVLANLQTSTEDENSNDAEWSLEVNPPIENLASRKLNIMKTWNMSDCKTANNFFWLTMFVDLRTEDSPNGVKLTVNSLKVHDKISVSEGSFDYLSAINIKVHTQKSSFPPEERDINIQESSEIRLITVQPATEIWSEIKNAVIINLLEQK